MCNTSLTNRNINVFLLPFFNTHYPTIHTHTPSSIPTYLSSSTDPPMLHSLFFSGHSGGLNPARRRILPRGSFVPGILNNIQQIRQTVYSSYHQGRYR